MPPVVRLRVVPDVPVSVSLSILMTLLPVPDVTATDFAFEPVKLMVLFPPPVALTVAAFRKVSALRLTVLFPVPSAVTVPVVRPEFSTVSRLFPLLGAVSESRPIPETVPTFGKLLMVTVSLPAPRRYSASWYRPCRR